jgi:hypothetical protein
MIYKKQLKELIEKTLTAIGLHSDSAVNLLLGTCAQESGFGKYLRQLKGGPALGIFQMEPNTFNDHVENYLKYKPELENKIKKFCGITHMKPMYLEWNIAFAICMSRIHYLRVRKGLPEPNDIEELAGYWKKYYNTYLGAGTVEEFIKNYNKYVK